MKRIQTSQVTENVSACKGSLFYFQSTALDTALLHLRSEHLHNIPGIMCEVYFQRSGARSHNHGCLNLRQQTEVPGATEDH